ncbi:GNAT family N-acetyltransferase [Amantichitinum ursilacus]|uniref:N-acetyltransferase domain-containing protein n=1 Tax=Amantichitinum ursilacus TaxID=857265 RepID=A0A0N0GQG5_9NEIS|nr:GNAT family N-acetyltransferase [Amantichitinum ursilacus]KPC54663.1 hypothetical protein WG78_03790 [Amantichitinum ursilacus]
MRLLRTERLTLEPQLASHAEEMFPVMCDPAIYEFENAPPKSVDSLRALYQRLESRQSPNGFEQWLNWILRLQDGTAIGYVQATLDAPGRATIAYELGSTWWGKGYASEGVRAMLDELLAHYGVFDFYATYKARNHRSARLLSRLEFQTCRPGPETPHLLSDEVLMYKGM